MGGLFYEHTAGRLKRKLKGYKRKHRKPIWNQRHRQRSEAKASEVAWRCRFMSFCLFTYGDSSLPLLGSFSKYVAVFFPLGGRTGVVDKR